MLKFHTHIFLKQMSGLKTEEFFFKEFILLKQTVVTSQNLGDNH